MRTGEGKRLLVNDSRVSNSINSLEHRYKVGTISLFIHVFLRKTRLSRRARSYLIAWAVDKIPSLDGLFYVEFCNFLIFKGRKIITDVCTNLKI